MLKKTIFFLFFLASQAVFSKTFEDFHFPKSGHVSEKICSEVSKQMSSSSFRLGQNSKILDKLEREALKNEQLIYEQQTSLNQLQDLNQKLTTYHQAHCRR